MSIKSLLQLILFFLIIIILGATYFLYFYSGPLGKDVIRNTNLNNINKFEENIKNLNDEANLEENLEEKKITNKNILLNGKKSEKQNKNANVKKQENLIKEIEYVTTNKNGDILKIFADFGETNIKDNNILNLKGVAGVFSSPDRSQINITSEFAKYNYKNQNSKFFEKVRINYENRIINCDNFDVNINENIAVAYNNVIVNDGSSTMKAQKITLNIITKDIFINSSDKIKILTN